MKRNKPRTMLAGVLLLIAVGGGSAVAQEPGAGPDTTAWLRHIAIEIARLRVDVIEHRIENARERLPQLENDLRAARLEQTRLESEEQTYRREIAQVNEHMEKTVDAEERSQMEVMRKDLETGALTQIRAARASTAQREEELNEKLQVERRRLEQLVEQARRLTAWLGGK